MTSKEALEIIRTYHNQISLLCKGKLNNKIINAENQIEKDLKALEIIKEHRFLFVEKGQLYVGKCCDVELLLEEDDFEDEHEYELLKEVFGNEDSNN